MRDYLLIRSVHEVKHAAIFMEIGGIIDYVVNAGVVKNLDRSLAEPVIL